MDIFDLCLVLCALGDAVVRGRRVEMMESFFKGGRGAIR
jgi:hypothetical protein